NSLYQNRISLKRYLNLYLIKTVSSPMKSDIDYLLSPSKIVDFPGYTDYLQKHQTYTVVDKDEEYPLRHKNLALKNDDSSEYHERLGRSMYNLAVLYNT